MHLGPTAAREFLDEFLHLYEPVDDRGVWLFPPAVSLEVVSNLVGGRPGFLTGAQNIHWESKGAFTGELSPPMARDAGAALTLVGHSERRHVFGETDEETGMKVRAALAHDLRPVLCVGETLAQRERDETVAVVSRQLGALEGLEHAARERVVIAYEPVWAIGTGKNASPADAAEVHRSIRGWLQERGVAPEGVSVLYGGSVKVANVRALLEESQIDGVLVGGASVDPESWAQITQTALD